MVLKWLWPAEAPLHSIQVLLHSKVGTLPQGGMPSDRTPTHIGHKAGCQCLLEHRVPVHVGQVGCILDITKAGQAALGVLGQELQTQGRRACLSRAPSEVSGALRAQSRENEGASALYALATSCPAGTLSLEALPTLMSLEQGGTERAGCFHKVTQQTAARAGTRSAAAALLLGTTALRHASSH